MESDLPSFREQTPVHFHSSSTENLEVGLQTNKISKRRELLVRIRRRDVKEGLKKRDEKEGREGKEVERTFLS